MRQPEPTTAPDADAVTPHPRTDFAAVPALIAQQAELTPDRTAIVATDYAPTYRELLCAAGGLAELLDEPDEPDPTPVGVVLPRGGRQLAALLGVLHSGRPYVCLDTAQPDARTAAQLRDCGVRTVIADRADGPFGGARVVPGEPAAWSAAGRRPVAPVGPADIAYVVFTSGSDGAPKAVRITHGGLSNYARALAEIVSPGSPVRRPLNFATVTSMATDLGHTAIYPSLIHGDVVHVVPAEIVRDPFAFADRCHEHPIDVLKITPSLLDALLDAEDPALLPGRTLILGGETLSWRLADRVRAVSGCRILNHYGPSETTVGSLVHDLADSPPEHRELPSVPIGRPIRDTWIRIVDGELRDVPDGTEGELLIGGAGVADGYLNAPERTRSAFPSPPGGAGRVYRTGDVVVRRPGGVVEFRSRADRQVKIRGHRVEPAEIEAALLSHDAVGRVAVTVAGGTAGPRLTAFVLPTPDAGPVSRDDLSGFLSGLLPTHLIPDQIVLVDDLPVTPSGKRDVRSLLDAESSRH